MAGAYAPDDPFTLEMVNTENGDDDKRKIIPMSQTEGFVDAPTEVMEPSKDVQEISEEDKGLSVKVVSYKIKSKETTRHRRREH